MAAIEHAEIYGRVAIAKAVRAGVRGPAEYPRPGYARSDGRDRQGTRRQAPEVQGFGWASGGQEQPYERGEHANRGHQ